jgi:hypothetical protein
MRETHESPDPRNSAELISRRPAADGLLGLAIKELIKTNYDLTESSRAMLRLPASLGERRRAGQRRNRKRHQCTVLDQLRREGDRHPSDITLPPDPLRRRVSAAGLVGQYSISHR